MGRDDPGGPGEADFHLGAPVRTDDGREVGSLVRLVVERDSWALAAIVVHERARFSDHPLGSFLRMFPDEVVVPARAVRLASAAGVTLALPLRAFRRLPPYLGYEYQPVSGQRAALEAVVRAGGVSTVAPLTEVAAKTEAEIEIREGERVMLGHGGRRLGDVEDVVYDEGELAGLVVRRARGGRRVLVPVRFLKRSDDGALFVTMREEQLEQLRAAEERSDSS